MIAYKVKEVEGVDSTFEPFPAWEVTRIQDGFGWHIGTWREKLAAEAVAHLLTGLAEHEAAR